MQKTRKAFTLVELLIAMLIMAASWYIAMTYSPKGQTAKREAQRLATLLEKTMAEAERNHRGFNLIYKKAEKNKFFISYGNSENGNEEELITATKDCTYELLNETGNNAMAKCTYSAEYGTMTPGATIEITGADGSTYCTKISGQGKVRTTEKRDDDDKEPQ